MPDILVIICQLLETWHQCGQLWCLYHCHQHPASPIIINTVVSFAWCYHGGRVPPFVNVLGIISLWEGVRGWSRGGIVIIGLPNFVNGNMFCHRHLFPRVDLLKLISDQETIARTALIFGWVGVLMDQLLPWGASLLPKSDKMLNAISWYRGCWIHHFVVIVTPLIWYKVYWIEVNCSCYIATKYGAQATDCNLGLGMG